MIDKKLDFILDKFLVEHNPDYDIDFTLSSSESIPLTQAANYDFKWRRKRADAKYNKYLGVVLKIVGGLKRQLPEYVANALDETKLIDAGNAALKQQIDRFYNITDSDINHKDKSGEARFAKYFTMTDSEGNLKEDLTVGPCLFKNMHRGQFYYPYPTKIDTGSQVVIKGRIIDALRKELTELTGVSKEDQKRFKWYVDFVNACRDLYGKAPKAKDVAKAFGVTVDHVKGLIARSTNARAALKNIGKPLSYDTLGDGTEYHGTQYDDDDIQTTPTLTTANMTNNALIGASSLDTNAIDRTEFTKFLQGKYTITDAQGNVTEVDPSAQFRPKLAGTEPTEDDLRELADKVIEYYKKNKTKQALAEKERDKVLSDFCKIHKDDLVNYTPQELIMAYNLHKSKHGNVNTAMSMGALNVSPDEVEYLTKEAKKIKEARDNEIAELTDKAKRGEELTEDEQGRLATALLHNYAALDQYEAANTIDEILDTPDDASPEDVETRDDLRNMLDYSVLGDPTCDMNPYKEGYNPDLDLGDEYLQSEFNRIKDTYYDPDLTPEERKELVYNYQNACAEIRDRRDDLEMLVCRMNPDENYKNFEILDNRIKNRGATVTFDGPEKDEPLEVKSSTTAKSEPTPEPKTEEPAKEPTKVVEPEPEPELTSSQSSEPELTPSLSSEPEPEPEPAKEEPEPEQQKKPKHRINLSSLGLEEPAKEEPKVTPAEKPKKEPKTIPTSRGNLSKDDVELAKYINSNLSNNLKEYNDLDDTDIYQATSALLTDPEYSEVKRKFKDLDPDDQEMTLVSISQKLRHKSINDAVNNELTSELLHQGDLSNNKSQRTVDLDDSSLSDMERVKSVKAKSLKNLISKYRKSSSDEREDLEKKLKSKLGEILMIDPKYIDLKNPSYQKLLDNPEDILYDTGFDTSSDLGSGAFDDVDDMEIDDGSNIDGFFESIRIFPAIGKEESVCQTLKTLTTNR